MGMHNHYHNCAQTFSLLFGRTKAKDYEIDDSIHQTIKLTEFVIGPLLSWSAWMVICIVIVTIECIKSVII